jgi:14-3-3 protein epsilon
MADENIFMARVAEQAERYTDMVDFLKPVTKEKKGNLTVEERNLLSVAFKNLIGQHRTALRTIGAIEQNPKYAHFSEVLGDYKKKIQNELFDFCEGIVSQIQNDILAHLSDADGKAFFLKMIGDYYRYMAESATGDKLKQVSESALKFYNLAQEEAQKLPACDPIKLGLALNFSVFHYEVINDSKQACKLAESALTEALSKLEDCDEDTFRDAKSIIELLKENLSLWAESDDKKDDVVDL